ncbi:HAD family hydrolase [Pseudonocardia sp. EC080610-09]|uniref:HAD-IB family hydrolase n=1 Tax=Pseudonocardia sp. P1 TaxID=761194 RepID=UPI0001FFECC2|nr:HAD family hydrolase [Pseudonocardia sp. EC080625-04]ALL77595.1 HAD family hydrolase [Pseudonocardia sp. EC080610-09]ALL80511.1 HAD family hydrolase [Pseudonocardia sp. EC080619-01]OLM17662.1 Phosphoserine phosphatase / 1-acyl-sn-glycerol-3-phosphate acyltransferase [Pseudonocardia sp. Ae707_Ps1]
MVSRAETARAERLRAIREAPPGPGTIAYFDYDGTVIDGYSAGAFYRKRLREFDVGPVEMVRTVLSGMRGIRTDDDFKEFLSITLATWKGRSEDELHALGRTLFKEEIAGALHPEVWELVAAHQEQGHQVVMASSATRFQVQPMAEELGADRVLCTELEVRDGVLTGRVAGISLWGAGKAAAVRADAEAQDAELTDCFGYANGTEDAEFLSAVGNPVAVSPTDSLRRVAVELGWPVLDCAPRGGLLPDVADVARTAVFYGGMAGGLAAAAGAGLLHGSRRRFVDLAASVGSDVAFGLSGIDVEVTGAEHLVAARPCVFVFNHQSKFDVPVLMKLLRGSFTGVAKKEAAQIPVWGQLFQMADVAFIDRGDSRQAREALRPAVAKLRDEGISLVIAPEGTRSPTPRLGRFKKGAFHIAMQAEVPIVPVVIRNAGEIMWRGAQTLRAGTVQVAVHPPVDTTNWVPENAGKYSEEIRDLFVDTLTHWPEGGTR